ncbi:MAG: hypothetical protein J0I47_00540 [Sphingomonas sp.]|uniref:hypothetical protein n=1 Tax=Sphingomonas sp. TaxID=28214 RepID=UPI001AC28EF7|nr:hypothetical protein [Sphingomonas sp.]MBN8806716.1 hypothetical protein [Sphingomonas sp.]
MRFLLGLIAIAAIVVIVLLWTGMLTLGGSVGSIKVTGTPPDITANMATVSVGTENKVIEVPKVQINKPGPAPSPTAPAQ